LDAGTAGVSDAGAIAGATSIDGSGDLTMATITMTGFTVDADGDTALKSLTVDDGSTIGSDSVADLITLAADGNITIKDGGFDFNIAAHDGTNGLKLGGTTVTSTATELNYLDGAVTTNNANAVKAVLIDASNDLTLANDLTVTNALTVSNSDLVVSTGNISGAGNLQLGGNITIAGDLTINGTTTTVNSTTLTVDDTNIVIADGGDAANANYGLTIGSTNPVTFQTKQTNGANSLASSVPVSASTYYGSGANLSGISADAASGFNVTPYNTDDYASSSFPGEIISTAGNKGVHAWTNANVTASYTFDLSGSYAAGNVVIIKGHGDTSTYPITIRPNDNSTNSIDGDGSIILESDFASVTMVYDGSGNWMVI
jgi:hypothetical protein